MGGYVFISHCTVIMIILPKVFLYLVAYYPCSLCNVLQREAWDVQNEYYYIALLIESNNIAIG